MRHASISTDTSWRSSVQGHDRASKGPMVLTGPMSLRMQRMSVAPEHRYVGGWRLLSSEGTSEADYLWRCRSGLLTPRPRSSRAGEVGWNALHLGRWNGSTPSPYAITMTEFREDLERRYTHRYQDPWYPCPSTSQSSRSSRRAPSSSHKHASPMRFGIVPEATSFHNGPMDDTASQISSTADSRLLARPRAHGPTISSS